MQSNRSNSYIDPGYIKQMCYLRFSSRIHTLPSSSKSTIIHHLTFCVETVVFLIPSQLCVSSLLTSVNLLSPSSHATLSLVKRPTISLLPEILLIIPFASPLSTSGPACTSVVTPLFFPISLLNPNSSVLPLLRLRI